jgi:hypothetical protein
MFKPVAPGVFWKKIGKEALFTTADELVPNILYSSIIGYLDYLAVDRSIRHCCPT